MPWPANAASPCSTTGHDPAARIHAFARLTGPRPPERHRVDRLEVARVRHQLHAKLAAVARAVGAGRAQVVLDVAAAEHALRVGVLEPREDVERRAADDLHDHIEPATVAHPDERLLEPFGRAGLEHLVEQGNERGHALEREPLRPRVAAVQHLFEQVRPHEALEHGARVDRREPAARSRS